MKKVLLCILKGHCVALTLAFAVGVIGIAPQIHFAFFTDDEYRGIHMLRTDAETHYLARINEVYDGHPGLGNVFLEGKDRPYILPPFGEILIATFGKALDVDAPDMNVASKFFFPPLLFLFWYAFIYKLFQSKPIAILATCLAFFGGGLFSLSGAMQAITAMMSLAGHSEAFLTYTRPINPQISGLFLIGGLHVLFPILKSFADKGRVNTHWMRIAAAGMIGGLSIYVYFYTWSFFAILLFLYFLYALYKKNVSFARTLLWVVVVHGLVTIPYWMNFIQAYTNPAYNETLMRTGVVSGHLPVFSFWLAASVLAIVFFWPKRYDQAKIVFLFIVIALWIAINQQVITGVFVQHGHYHWFITKPLVVSSIAAMLFVFLLEKCIARRKLQIAFVSLAVAVLFYNGLLVQTSAYKSSYTRAIEEQRYAEIVSFLQANYHVKKTIWMQSDRMSTLLAGYTPHDFLHSGYARYYLIGRNFFIERLFLEYRLRGVKPQEVKEAMVKEKGHVSGSIFGMYYREKFGDETALPQGFLEELEMSYKSFFEQSFSDVLKDFHIGLVIWDKKNEPGLIYRNIPELREVARVGDGFVIYENRI